MKKTLAIVALVLCAMLFCTMAMASDGNDFKFNLYAGNAFGSGRITSVTSSRHKKADNENRAYVTITERDIKDEDKVRMFVVEDGHSSAQTEKLYVDASSPSLDNTKTLKYNTTYDTGRYYRLRCEAVTLWKDAMVAGRWNP